MTYDIQAGNVTIRAQVIDEVVKQTAARAYKFKQAVAIVPTSAWKNTFYREKTDVLTGQSGNSIRGVPRGANFPQASASWEEVSVRILKFALEENIPWEDTISDSLNILARSTIKVTEGVTKAVDDFIFQQLCDTFFTDALAGYNSEDLKIQSYAVGSGIAGSVGGRWNETSAAIINDLMGASRFIAEKNYDTSDLMLFISPKDKQGIMNYLASKGAQFPLIATSVTENGNIGQLAGIRLVESNSVPTSYALLVKPKTCATYKELVGLTSQTTEDPYKSIRIRVVEEGTLELTDPKAVVLIKNTQAG